VLNSLSVPSRVFILFDLIKNRYDKSKSLKANLNIGPALMSRFDLFFIVLDECDEAMDLSIPFMRTHLTTALSLLYRYCTPHRFHPPKTRVCHEAIFHSNATTKIYKIRP
jgi:hypothetical protein